MTEEIHKTVRLIFHVRAESNGKDMSSKTLNENTDGIIDWYKMLLDPNGEMGSSVEEIIKLYDIISISSRQIYMKFKVVLHKDDDIEEQLQSICSMAINPDDDGNYPLRVKRTEYLISGSDYQMLP
jgi:hypothetical protein